MPATAVFLVLVACTREPDGSSAAPRAKATAAAPRTTTAPTPAASARNLGVEVAAAIRPALAEGSEPELSSLAQPEREGLVSLYSPGGYSALWVDAAGHPSADAATSLGLLAGAAGEGLDPAEYRADALTAMAAALRATPSPPAAAVADFDLGVSVSMLRYLRHLHAGRVEPRSIGFKMTAPADVHDYGSLLLEAITGHQVAETAAKLTPPLALYRRLRAALARYRELAADPTLASPPPSGPAVRPGEPHAGLDALRRLLVALGDLPPEVAAAELPATYEGALVEGVKRFQLRHGLEPDGVLGKSTLAALGVPLDWRARQIELALERLRWPPHLNPERFLAVNIPMFRLWVWQGIPADGAPKFGMDVIVGRALDTQTPVFVEEMQYIVFHPYWNVTPSILRGEILPAIRRDATYLERHDMEIVEGPGDEAPPVALTAETLALLGRGKLRVRQRPGPRNALGLVKFVFPNDDNVYLHSTPAPELFRRSRRDFSHGCVRVEDPVKLAEWALQGEEGWTRERISTAIHGPRPVRATLTHPIQVILFYLTAVVMPEDRSVHFAEDIYGHDGKLDRALRARSRAAAAENEAAAPPDRE